MKPDYIDYEAVRQMRAWRKPMTEDLKEFKEFPLAVVLLLGVLLMVLMWIGLQMPLTTPHI